MIEKFKQISREAIYGPISYDPDLKESLDEYVQRTKLNATQEEQLKEKKWKTKLEEQQKYPWLKKK